jgi:hypothetical protein
MSWINKDRPGFFGRNRDKIIAGYNLSLGLLKENIESMLKMIEYVKKFI